jgi:hypothetical protein
MRTPHGRTINLLMVAIKRQKHRKSNAIFNHNVNGQCFQFSLDNLNE